NGIVGGVAFKYNQELQVKVPEDQGSSEGLLEELKDTLALTVPVSWGLLPGEMVQGFCDAGVVVDWNVAMELVILKGITSNLNVIVPRTEVEFGVDFGALELVDEISDEGKGVSILLSDFIEAPVVNTEAERAILLLDKQYWGTGSRDQGSDEFFTEHFIKIVLEGMQFDLRHVVDFDKGG
ncbi:hypothetical protein C0992_007750, partial [Termitomyces sp. T32_za158]